MSSLILSSFSLSCGVLTRKKSAILEDEATARVATNEVEIEKEADALLMFCLL